MFEGYGIFFYNKIVFCSKDVGNKLTYPLFKRQCEFIQWLDGYYKRLQIFNLKYSAKVPMFSSHQFEDDGVNEMLRHRYIFGLESIIDNHLIDSVGNAHGYVLLAKDYYSIQR